MSNDEIKGLVVNKATISLFLGVVGAFTVVWTSVGYVTNIERDIIEIKRKNSERSLDFREFSREMKELRIAVTRLQERLERESKSK